ncbi:patatin-like phospholipase family protein [Heliophilum fasciatum]|nr:patatin-like phospholipase family protein [Heliophilum fasciatum]MCW2276630.1 NTE family protein [Heliophilum fasciatum]
MKWALILSGGGSRGAAHVGVIKALEEARLRPSLVIGVSAGSYVAALYGTGAGAADMVKIAQSLSQAALFDFDWRWAWQAARNLGQKLLGHPNSHLWPELPSGVLRGRRLEQFFTDQWGEQTLDQTDPPTVITATDLISGYAICFTPRDLLPKYPIPYRQFISAVPIAQAARSSCSLPGVFQPFPLGDLLLVDGAVRNNMPADVARALGADLVISVNLRNPGQPVPAPANLITTMVRSTEILGYEVDLCTTQTSTDLLIEPHLDDMGLFDFASFDAAIQAGYRATVDSLPALHRLLHSETVSPTSSSEPPSPFPPAPAHSTINGIRLQITSAPPPAPTTPFPALSSPAKRK